MKRLPYSILQWKKNSASTATKPTSTAAQSRSAIRWPLLARASSSPCSTNCAARACAMDWRLLASAAARASPSLLSLCRTRPRTSFVEADSPAPCEFLDHLWYTLTGGNFPPVVHGSAHVRNFMAIQKVGVVGCGLMGSGIAHVSAQAGFSTVVREVSAELVEKGLKSIEKNMARQVEKGTLTEQAKNETRARLKGTTSLEDLKDCDVIVEAIIEQLPMKRELFGALDKLCPPQTIFASNTSSLPIIEIAASTKRPQRFVGLHFFNPVPMMKLVEVVKTIATDSAVYEEMVAFGAKLGKTPVRARDSTGFIVNRLLVPYLLDAIRALEERVGSVVDIDNSMKLGCGYPMGPFTLLDFVGLDTTYYISQIMFEEYKEKRFAAPPLLKRMVLAGWYGKKSGRGFYDYSDAANPKPMSF